MNLGLNDRILRVVVGLSMVLFDYAADVNWGCNLAVYWMLECSNICLWLLSVLQNTWTFNMPDLIKPPAKYRSEQARTTQGRGTQEEVCVACTLRQRD